MNFIKSTVLLIILIASVNIIAQDPIKRFDFKKAHLKMDGTTDAQGVKTTISKEIFIDNYGNNMASFETEKREISMANLVEETKRVVITEGNVVTTYDPETMEGTSVTIDMMNTFAGMSDQQAQQFAEQMGEATNTEVTEEGTGEVAGVMCNIIKAVTDMMGMQTITTTWSYKKFNMKTLSESDIVNVYEEVNMFKEGADFDPSVLLVPAGANIEVIESPF
ncbi:MAG: hypothetical protein HKP17_13895 [Ignavibacteriaceae bacterium]|nr:hypothetical protein [Ignavibacteria bacterium]NNJ54258.1 hypothetical protein [Ignavibacteriaceae bacterium]